MKAEKVLTHVFVWTPPLAFVVGIIGFWNHGVDALSLVLFVSFVFISGLGITVGFHRFFTHKSFEARSVVKYVLAIAGMSAAQMSLIGWVACHRKHHQYSDDEEDPHSPHHHGGGCLGVIRGLLHAHMLWFSKEVPESERYAPDLMKDKTLARMSALYPVWVAVGLLLPAFIAFACTGKFYSAFLGFIWGGVIRLGAVYHITWSVNSICHIWGSSPFATGDQSRNNLLIGLLAMGEGWHNNHHAFPTSARHGLRWWQPDLSWFVIRFLKLVRLARKIKVPSPEDIARVKRRARIM